MYSAFARESFSLDSPTSDVADADAEALACWRSQEAARRLTELVLTAERTALWTSRDILTAYRQCCACEQELEAKLISHSGQKLSEIDCLVTHGLRDLLLARQSIRDAFQACANRFSDVDDLDVKDKLDACRLARQHAEGLRQYAAQNVRSTASRTAEQGALHTQERYIEPHSDSHSSPRDLMNCLRSGDALLTIMIAVTDTLAQQTEMKILMHDLFAQRVPLITAEEVLFHELRDTLDDISDALVTWFDCGRVVNTVARSSYALNPRILLTSSSHSSHSAESLNISRATSISPFGTNTMMTAVAQALLGPSPPTESMTINRWRHGMVGLNTDDCYVLDTEHGVSEDISPLIRRGALRRRQQSLPIVRVDEPIPTDCSITANQTTQGSTFTWSSSFRRRRESDSDLVSVLSRRRSGYGDIYDVSRRSALDAEMRSTDAIPLLIPSRRRSSNQVPVDTTSTWLNYSVSDTRLNSFLSVLSSDTSTHSGTQSLIVMDLAEVYERYHCESPDVTNTSHYVPSRGSIRSTRRPDLIRLEETATTSDLLSDSLDAHHGHDITPAFQHMASTGYTQERWPPDVHVDEWSMRDQRFWAWATAPMNEPNILQAQARHHNRDSLWAFCRNLMEEIYNMTPRPCMFGGLADVYRAAWISEDVNMHVAIKVQRSRQPDKALRRLRHEVKVWLQLDHPNVLPLCGLYFGISDLPALVSPWCNNGDIGSYLKTREGEAGLWKLKLKLLQQVLEGLTYLHGCTPEVVHGDLKGANILISDSHDVYLCDFGFASMLAEEEGSLSRQSSSAKGTWRWMAPELFTVDDARHTKESDVWAFGCVVFEVLSGKVPYHEKRNDRTVIIAIAHGEHPSKPARLSDVSWIDAKLWTMMLDCWKKNPDDRPPVASLLTRLRHYRAQLTFDV